MVPIDIALGPHSFDADVSARVLDRSNFDVLFEQLHEAGYTVVGPTLHEDSIVYDTLSSSADLPVGMTSEQQPGHFRVVERDDEALFGYAVGPQSWKKFLFPPRTTLWHAVSENGNIRFEAREPADTRYAFLGARSCELAAMSIQDRVFTGGPGEDPTYSNARNDALTVAVNCGVPGGTCFCVSMGTGPKCESGYDLVLTELIDEDGHRFLVEAGTDTGASILEGLPTAEATTEDVDLSETVMDHASKSMGRTLDTEGVRGFLADSPEHPRWDEIASRCLACTNCTLVCPTCFCSTTEDATDLHTGDSIRSRRWDSCFTLDFSVLHGSPVRTTTKARYRQWLTHKLSTWYDQFGVSGCVGCGRCITWCPVGIDITVEVEAMRPRVKEIA
ncbi:MAG: 4Fe-4S dicluster domain-containing protein [Acidimicrobiia bacterium]